MTFPRLILVPAPRVANCAHEYTYEAYGTARYTIELSSGSVELRITNPDVFTTDRLITQSEYETIRSCLRQLVDNAMMQSDPSGLVGK